MSFETEALRDCCLISEKAELQLGGPAARDLSEVLANLEAFDLADEMFDFLGSDAIIDDTDRLILNIGTTHLATFVAVGASIPRTRRNDVDWPKVKLIKLTEIAGIHE